MIYEISKFFTLGDLNLSCFVLSAKLDINLLFEIEILFEFKIPSLFKVLKTGIISLSNKDRKLIFAEISPTQFSAIGTYCFTTSKASNTFEILKSETAMLKSAAGFSVFLLSYEPVKFIFPPSICIFNCFISSLLSFIIINPLTSVIFNFS